jgi:CRISPR/Cas system-associated exonuclease Cas4 (RecB family)
MTLDATTLKDYMSCPRKYYWRHERGIIPDTIGIALSFGLAVHEGLEHAYKWLKDNPGEEWTPSIVRESLAAAERTFAEHAMPDLLVTESLRTPGKLLNLMADYFAHYPGEAFEVVDVERAFALGVSRTGFTGAAYSHKVPDDGRMFSWVGKMDVVVRWPYGLTVIDHKTTKQLGYSFADKWNPDTQMTGYVAALRALYPDEKIHGAMINAIQVAKTKSEVVRVPTTRTEGQLTQFHTSIVAWADRIMEDKVFPMNTQACDMYGACPYRDLCIRYPNPVDNEDIPAAPDGYRVEVWDPHKRLMEGEES